MSSLQPAWDVCTNSLYYSELAGTVSPVTIYRHAYNENKLYAAAIEGNLTQAASFFPVGKCGDNQSVGHSLLVLQWDGVSPVAKVVETLFTVTKADNSTLTLVNIVPEVVNGFLMGQSYHRAYCDAPNIDFFSKFSTRRHPVPRRRNLR